MTATRDLIAAALTAADLMEGMIGESYRPVGAALREMCARAMCEPDIAEVERLVGEYGAFVVHFAPGDALESLERLNQLVGEKRAALQRLVRGMLAERDELIHDNERLSGLYEQAVKGRAGMRSALRDARAAAPRPVSAAEVPMQCGWYQDGDEESTTWQTSCGAYFTLNEGTPSDNRFSFCYSCGKHIVEYPIDEGAALRAED